MEESGHNKFMRRCLELASAAEGMTYPNPLVGSVVVYDGKIIGEGYHLRAGGPHAEVVAISSVSDKSLLKGSTLYVNLEPCSHFGKTPPCADFIIANKIPRVVIGTVDTSKKVSGKGVKKLKDAGCEVISGILEAECRWLNRRFFTSNEKQRPWIVLKWAQSADGYIDILRPENNAKKPTWISGKPERILVHKWRASEQSILVGAGTIRADNPRLNVREWKGNDPVRLILSKSGVLRNDIAVNETNGTVVVFSHNTGSENGKTVKVKLEEGIPSSEQIMGYLNREGIQSLFIEGGAEVLNHFLSEGLWDEARIFTGKRHFNGGLKAPVVKGINISSTNFEGSLLEVFLNECNKALITIDNIN
ncbi:MAG: bifunctional diaminohydroxyphosphoribosylaminopyrimidine deaminase/5-amino-6-(5-phosphoribosylamino)uracil reductase RibD [Bacteroidales bacterium]|nr:bifunctional diaminohydroxyphosphoribosylaminopyrimidine deaminase/5-amino-6-(5-phosphoribosylamino)uracil reductase RibD [Bacteroidales bacterium]